MNPDSLGVFGSLWDETYSPDSLIQGDMDGLFCGSILPFAVEFQTRACLQNMSIKNLRQLALTMKLDISQRLEKG